MLNNKNIKIGIIYLFGILCLAVNAQPQLPRFKVSVNDKSIRGYFLFSPVKIGASGQQSGFTDIILDHTGNLVYVKNHENGFLAGNLRQHKNGSFSYFFDKKIFVLDSLLRATDTVFCQNGISTDTHDFLILPNGNYALLGIEHSTMNLSKYFIFKKNGTQGLENAMVNSGVIQELTPAKKVVFEWHSKEHYQFDDIDTAYVNNLYDIDWTHFNALEFDYDGNYLVSSKHFNEITKVNRSTGKIMWRLGGNRNEFGFINDTLKFLGQHNIRRLPNKFITLFDNGSNRGKFHPETAKEYRLDEFHKAITLIWSHVNDPSQYSKGYGSVQRQTAKNTLVSYGRSEKGMVLFNYLNNNGKVLYEVTGKDSLYTYRAQFITHLSEHLPRPQLSVTNVSGSIVIEVKNGVGPFYWSNGESGRKITVAKNGTYYVCTPFGSDAYLYSKPIVIENGRVTDTQ